MLGRIGSMGEENEGESNENVEVYMHIFIGHLSRYHETHAI